jgi:hypothetical protein
MTGERKRYVLTDNIMSHPISNQNIVLFCIVVVTVFLSKDLCVCVCVCVFVSVCV